MKKIISISALLFHLLANVCAGQKAVLPAAPNHFIVIAHRGDHTIHPENTLEAFEAAIKNGVDYVEVDLRTTKDGRLVLMHDASVKRMTGIDGNIKDLTRKQIKKLNIASKNSNTDKTYRIPDFVSVLRLCKGRINIYLDFKDADVAKTFRMIKQEGMEKQVIVYLNNEQHYKAWQVIAPQMPLITSMPENISPSELSTWLASKQINSVDDANNAEQVEVLKKQGIALWMDEKRDNNCKETLPVTCSWQDAINMGATGIQTDHPEALIRFLKTKNLR